MTGLESNGTRPDASQLTLRFKSGKTTLLLFVTPTDDFDAIKAELLRALADAGLKDVNGAPIPADPADVELAVPVNRNDPSKGWVALEDASDAEESKRTKISDRTPQAADLKDNAMLAFRFRGAKKAADRWDVQLAVLDDLDDQEAECAPENMD